MGEKIPDLLIIGSGPAGLTAGIYARRANLTVQIVEKEYRGTGQIADSGRVDNYPGLPGIGGYELGEQFRGHAEKCGVSFTEGEAGKLWREEGKWKCRLEDGRVLEARAIIYAAGTVHRQLRIPGEQQFFGKGVHVCAWCDGAFYKDRVAAVIGGGDSAVDAALYLAGICKKVLLIHRREDFRAAKSYLLQAEAEENIEILRNTVVSKIEGTHKAEAIWTQDNRRLPVDGIFVEIGQIPRTEILRELAVTDENGYIQADETGRTALKGFYGAGDVRTKSLRQVITAAADGANAAVLAAEDLRRTTEKEV